MEKQKEQRVVLNLSKFQAGVLKGLLENDFCKTSEVAQKLLKRITKTIGKYDAKAEDTILEEARERDFEQKEAMATMQQDEGLVEEQ